MRDGAQGVKHPQDADSLETSRTKCGDRLSPYDEGLIRQGAQGEAHGPFGSVGCPPMENLS